MSAWQEAVKNLLRIPKAEPVIYKPNPTVKVCSDCGAEKHVTEFYKRASKCKPCQILYVAKWKRENRKWG